jgi:hypothetical protein
VTSSSLDSAEPATAGQEEGRPPAPAEVAVTASGHSPVLAVALALLFPGLGHLYLGRRGRAAVFALVVLAAIIAGVMLEGNLWTPIEGRPLTWLATLGAMGMGLPYFLLLHGMRYAGNLTGPGYEYGTAFLLGAGLMNLLLVLDAWDIATGRKE